MLLAGLHGCVGGMVRCIMENFEFEFYCGEKGKGTGQVKGVFYLLMLLL